MKALVTIAVYSHENRKPSNEHTAQVVRGARMLDLEYVHSGGRHTISCRYAHAQGKNKYVV